MSKIYKPTAGAADWQGFLADPDKQWRTGFSAKTLAHCWEAGNGLPTEIASILRPLGADLELLLALPEYKVALPGTARGESQNDVFALVRAGGKTFAVMVEGKVSEPFGETLGDWLQNASDGKRDRLAFMSKLLGLTLPLPNDIRYQLLHRTASAVIEAQRFNTEAAVMLVHSFSSDRKWFGDFVRFASLFGVSLTTPNELFPLRANAKPPLYVGWVCGDCKFLSA
jgi:hypothetical protein